jgi:hypothetical protein
MSKLEAETEENKVPEVFERDQEVTDVYDVPIQHMEENMGVLQAAWRYRRLAFYCFLASLTAGLDGYQGESSIVLRN